MMTTNNNSCLDYLKQDFLDKWNVWFDDNQTMESLPQMIVLMTTCNKPFVNEFYKWFKNNVLDGSMITFSDTDEFVKVAFKDGLSKWVVETIHDTDALF